MNRANGWVKKLILIAFALSGMTALVYEVAWTRPLQLIFGSTVYAASTILTTFLLGAAIGAFAFRNFADRTKNPLAAFACIQLVIGLYGIIILHLFKIMHSIFISVPSVQEVEFVQFLLLFAVLIIPTILFGATWPLVNKAYNQLSSLGHDTGKLYSFNAFGSFVGSIGAGFVLIPLLGITSTSVLVACINILIGIVLHLYLRTGVKNEA